MGFVGFGCGGFCGQLWVWWLMGFMAGCGCCCDGIFFFFFFFQWWWLAMGCKFMVMASGVTMEAVEVAVDVGLDFVVVVYYYFNEFYIILNDLLKI